MSGIFEGLEVRLSRDGIFVPGFMVVCNKDIITKRGIEGAPDLVVEIPSPSTAKRDKIQKKNAYEKAGVKEYWLVNIDSKSIEVYWLQDDKFVLNNLYIIPPDMDIEEMTEGELAKIVYEFKTSLFDDFVIDIREVFEDI